MKNEKITKILPPKRGSKYLMFKIFLWNIPVRGKKIFSLPNPLSSNPDHVGWCAMGALMFGMEFYPNRPKNIFRWRCKLRVSFGAGQVDLNLDFEELKDVHFLANGGMCSIYTADWRGRRVVVKVCCVVLCC